MTDYLVRLMPPSPELNAQLTPEPAAPPRRLSPKTGRWRTASLLRVTGKRRQPAPLPHPPALTRSRAEREAWQQARLATVAVQRFMHRGLDGSDLQTLGVGMLALAAVGAWRRVGARPTIAGLMTAGLLAPPLGRAVLRAALPWLSRRYRLLPSIFLEAGPALSEWTA